MARGQRMAAGDMDKIMDKLSKLDLMETKLCRLEIMETKLSRLEIMEKKLDTINDLQKSLVETKAELAGTKKDLDEVREMTKDLKEKVDGLEGGLQGAGKRGLEGSNALLNLQLQNMAYFLRFQNLVEEPQEDLRLMVVKILDEYMGESLGWDVDQVYRVNTLYASKHGVPREVHVKFVRRETREMILKKQRTQAMRYRDREITILKQIPRQVREMRRKYHFLSSKLYLKGIGFRWLMPEGLVVFREGVRKRISTVQEAKAYLEESKTLLEPEEAVVEEGEVVEEGAGAAMDPGDGQVELRVLRSRTKK